MLRAVRLVASSLLSLLVLAAPGQAQSRQFERTVTLDSGGYLSLEATKGSVKLSSWDRNEVQIHAVIRAEARLDADYARRTVEATTVDVTGGGGDVRIRSNYDQVPYDKEGLWVGSSRRVPEIHYEIRAPRKVQLRLDLDRSDTTLTSFEGRIDLVADRSRLDLKDLTGAISVEVDRGGDSRVEQVAGSLRIDADRTNLRVEFARLEEGSSVEADRGDVDITVPAGQGFTLDAHLSRRSDFDSQLPIQIRNWRSNQRRFTTDVNGGGPRLAIEMDRGRVSLGNR
jgi:hypothetical protein